MADGGDAPGGQRCGPCGGGCCERLGEGHLRPHGPASNGGKQTSTMCWPWKRPWRLRPRVFPRCGTCEFPARRRCPTQGGQPVGTANVVNAALSAGIRRLVHIGSVAALGRSAVDPETGTPCPCTSSPTGLRVQGASPYGVSKHAGEMEVWRGVAEGLSAFAVNPTVILGRCPIRGEFRMIYRRAAAGSRFYPIGGNGFVGVADVVSVIAALDDGGGCGPGASSGSASWSRRKTCCTAT